MASSALLKGKVALIAGAATGIGQTGAQVFAQQGARVVVADINDVEGNRTVNDIRAQGGEAAFVHADLEQVGQIEEMVREAAGTYGRLDIFWHNAGGARGGHIEAVTTEDFDKQMALDLRAAVFGAKYALPEIRKSGGGSMLFTSSMAGLRPHLSNPTHSICYPLAKAAIVMLVRCLTVPLAKHSIRVNCICPGPVLTPRSVEARRRKSQAEGVKPEEYLRLLTGPIPMGREVTREEVAGAALFLVSDAASGVTGVAFPVDGGYAAV